MRLLRPVFDPAERHAVVLVLVALLVIPLAPGNSARAQGDEESRSIIVGAHERFQLTKEVLRVAVGNPELLSVETLTAKELLVLGRAAGQTTLIVWYRDDTVESFRFMVRPDLSLLEEVLREVHPSITVVAE